MARRTTPRVRTRAGVKLRDWRLKRERKLAAREAAELFGTTMQTLYRIETGQRETSREVAAAIVRQGICDYADFFEPADAPAMCTRCELRVDGPKARGCTLADCPRRRVA